MFANGPLNIRCIRGATWQQLLSEPFLSKVMFQVFYFDGTIVGTRAQHPVYLQEEWNARLNIYSAKICVVLVFNKSLEITKVLLCLYISYFRFWWLSQSAVLRIPIHGKVKYIICCTKGPGLHQKQKDANNPNIHFGQTVKQDTRGQQTREEHLNSLCVNASLGLWHDPIK